MLEALLEALNAALMPTMTNARDACNLLSPAHDLGDGVSYDSASLLCLLLRQTAGHTHFECRGRLPASVAGV